MMRKQQKSKVLILLLQKRIHPQKNPQPMGIPKSTFLELEGFFGKNGLLFRAICGKLSFKGCILG